jgi:hypothetical protein
VANKIYGWDKEHGIDALKALAVIIIIELRSGRKGDMVFCSELFLKLCLREMPVENLDKVYPLIKGYLLEEAPIQSSSTKIVTRNPIISEIFYKILFDAEDSLLDEADILDSILRVISVPGGDFGSNGSFGKYLLHNLPFNYLNRKPELAKQLYHFLFDNNGDFETGNSARWLCKEAFDGNISNNDLSLKTLSIWVIMEYQTGNTGDVGTHYSGQWLLTKFYKILSNANDLGRFADKHKSYNGLEEHVSNYVKTVGVVDDYTKWL